MAVSDQVCPDPSAHQKSHQSKGLQDQAATAALYVTHPERGTNVRDMNPLGPDGKLSSAGAAASLKYARPQDLPSFPSVGIDTKNSGLSAATLATSNHKNLEWWTPTMSENASKAAMLAKDYKMAPLWQPEASAAGSKAAILAANGKGRDWWQPTASKEGNQAATLAMRNKNLSPQLDYGHTEIGQRNSMLAAKASLKGRRRAGSTPDPNLAQYDGANRGSNALKAAGSAHHDDLGPKAHARNLTQEEEAEKKEQNYQGALKASSIAIAKGLYKVERLDDSGKLSLNAGQAARTADSQSTGTTIDLRTQAIQYLHLQEAAQKLAAERLAKIEDQHEAAAFRDYYGYGSPKRRSRLSMAGRNRRRASSESAGTRVPMGNRPPTEGGHRRRNLDVDSDDDEVQATRVRNQMSQLNAKLGQVDNSKRSTDRNALMAAAEKKVQAQMSKMDEKVYNDTGKMSPAMVEDWDKKARTKAAAASQVRMATHEKNQGKVDVGGGKFIDQSEIDAIAAANVQPTLDQINLTAEKQRARDVEVRLDRAENKRHAQLEKERAAETKALEKKAKAEDKEAERTKKREEKEAGKPHKVETVDKEKNSSWRNRLSHDKNRRESGKLSTSSPSRAAVVAEPHTEEPVTLTPTGQTMASDPDSFNTVAGEKLAHDPESGLTPVRNSTAREEESENEMAGGLGAASTPISSSKPVPKESEETPTSKKRFSKILGKLKRSKKDTKDESEKGFIGGNTLTKRTNTDTSQIDGAAAVPSPIAAATTSTAPRIPSPSISSLSSDFVEQEPERGRSSTRLDAVPASASASGAKGLPKVVGTGNVTRLAHDDDSDDDFEEARDRFDDSLVPPPTLLSKKTESPVRDSKFHEEI